tara:strand:- start:178 stop:396 length:219 start_codon:yes stop_codon:yes gene_type:complete
MILKAEKINEYKVVCSTAAHWLHPSNGLLAPGVFFAAPSVFALSFLIQHVQIFLSIICPRSFIDGQADKSST